MKTKRQKITFLSKLSEILKQPLPLNLNIVNTIIGSITFGAFVFFFLIVFKPFGLQVLSGKALIKITSGYGLVTAGYLTIHSLIMLTILAEKNWTVGKEIINTLIIITMIGLCNYLYHSIYSSQTFILVELIEFQLEALAVSFLPISLITLFRLNIMLKRHLGEAEEINRNTNWKFSDDRDDKLVVISAQNPKSDFSCKCSDILFFRALDNYVIIHFIKDSKYLKDIIRTTLKKVKDNLNDYPNFFHCHKSYIVNLDKVIKVSGNAQGLKLHLDYTKEIIPVSRQLHKKFKHLFE
jgi:DNA-binding LytR/AlgR family response regulator